MFRKELKFTNLFISVAPYSLKIASRAIFDNTFYDGVIISRINKVLSKQFSLSNPDISSLTEFISFY